MAIIVGGTMLSSMMASKYASRPLQASFLGLLLDKESIIKLEKVTVLTRTTIYLPKCASKTTQACSQAKSGNTKIKSRLKS